jgi:hypothetical protein
VYPAGHWSGVVVVVAVLGTVVVGGAIVVVVGSLLQSTINLLASNCVIWLAVKEL